MMPRGRVWTRYWCHQCLRAFHLNADAAAECPYCDDGFVEEIPSIETPLPPTSSQMTQAQSVQMADAVQALISHFHGRNRRGHRLRPATMDDDASSSGMVVLRGMMDEQGGVELLMSRRARGFTLDQVVEHLALAHAHAVPGSAACGTTPAARSAVEALPTVHIAAKHLRAGHNTCAVCTEDFDIGGEAKEMPCKHVYHEQCILPWLATHNSCPVCRHQLPSDPEADEPSLPSQQHQRVGLTIWGLPGGGFALSRIPPPPTVAATPFMRSNSASAASDSNRSSRGGRRGGGGFLSSLWPFRRNGSSSSSSSSSTNRRERHSRWFF